MDRWWQRTDGQPGMSWPAAILLGLAFAVGALAWSVATEDGPLDGDLVAAGAGGILVTVFVRVDIKGRVGRTGSRHREDPRP